MKRKYIILLIIILLIALPNQTIFAQVLTPVPIVITFPKDGNAIQGIVSIKSNISIDNFLSASAFFRYTKDNTDTWFLIGETKKINDGNIAIEWDTTTISDGNYDIKIVIKCADDTTREALANNIRVRNYSQIETNTPDPFHRETNGTPEPTNTATMTATPIHSPTPLPTNPATISPKDIGNSIKNGAIFIFVVFLVFGVYLGMRTWHLKDS